MDCGLCGTCCGWWMRRGPGKRRDSERLFRNLDNRWRLSYLTPHFCFIWSVCTVAYPLALDLPRLYSVCATLPVLLSDTKLSLQGFPVQWSDLSILQTSDLPMYTKHSRHKFSRAEGIQVVPSMPEP